MPVDPEEQKSRIMKTYEVKLKKAEKQFTPRMERRYKCLMKHVSYQIVIKCFTPKPLQGK